MTVIYSVYPGKEGYQVSQPGPGQWLAASEPDLGDAHLDGRLSNGGYLLVGQDIIMREQLNGPD